MFIINIIVFLLVLSLVIVIHELGHFIMARKAGILCHEFSLGMGPILYSKKKGETLYAIRAIPIGGFVMMAGEDANDDVLKSGNKVGLRYNEADKVSEIVVKPSEDQEDVEIVTIEKFNLSGEKDALHINGIPVSEKAHYVFDDKKLQIAPKSRRFDSKSVFDRFKAIFAGPFMNFVLAFVLFLILGFIIGAPSTNAEGDVTTTIGSVEEGYPADGVIEVGDTVTYVNGQAVDNWDEFSGAIEENRSLRNLPVTFVRDGEVVTDNLTPRISIYNMGFSSHPEASGDVIIGPVPANTPADDAGLQEGDEIVEIGGETVTSWETVMLAAEENTEGERMVIEVMREGEEVRLHIEPHDKAILDNQNVDPVDIVVGVSPEHEADFFHSISYGFTGIAGASTMIFDTLGLLFSSTVGVSDLSGPVGIYTITSNALSQGLVTFINWTALLSVNLGILNLLPIPALDGGRLVFLGYEGITKRKVNRTVENYLHAAMFILLIGLFFYITYHDILRLLNIG
ncbi:MAG: RIP metalloprotease RseP [Bacillota bacterium]